MRRSRGAGKLEILIPGNTAIRIHPPQIDNICPTEISNHITPPRFEARILIIKYKDIRPGIAGHGIDTPATSQHIAPTAAKQPVISGAGQQRVVATSAQQPVIPRLSYQPVIARRPRS